MTRADQATVLTEAVYYILLSLQQPRHGYGIMQFVQELSNDRVKLAAGTLYGALSSLVDKGWIESIDQEAGRKKEYIMTNQGRVRLQQELDRLKELVRHGQETMGVEQSEQ